MFMTISEVSKAFSVSTRMLRYYEKAGLLKSCRKEDYSYRVYDENAVRRLRQIIVLRKLRIPLKQIAVILDDDTQTEALNIFISNLNELTYEISALSTVRDILEVFVSRLNESIRRQVRLDLLEDSELLKAADALYPSRINLKEDHTMNELNNADQTLGRGMDIRYLYLPPAVVVSSQYTGENPEDHAARALRSFIEAVNLPAAKPDFRVYGFNNPCPKDGAEFYGYEFWATIPEDMEVPAPLVKKEFAGGLYAAHCIRMGDFHEWNLFFNQLSQSAEYDIELREPLGMSGWLEEHLNVYSYYTGQISEIEQLDLLIPVRKKDI